MQLRPYQQKLHDDIYAAWAAGHRNVLAQLWTGGGKCLARGTPVLLASGAIVPVEEIQVGMRLASPTSSGRTVLSLARGREKMYRVTPVKGDPYVVNASHLLSLMTTPGAGGDILLDNGQRIGRNDTVVTVRADVLAASNYKAKHCLKGWRWSVGSFEGEAKSLPMPPYILGIWLGDGTAEQPHITKPEGPQVSAWLTYGASMGLGYRREDANGTRCPTWCLTNGRIGPSENPVSGVLRRLGVWGEKHIPHSYKTAAWDDRLELIAGLLDSDGYLGHSGYDWISSNREMAVDFAFVCRSVGLACYVTETTKSIKSAGFTGTYWRCSVSGDCERIPCRVKKSPPRLQKKRHHVHGITLTELPEDDYFGFELDGDRLFMLGDFTVTHNTVTFAHIVKEERGAVAVLAHRGELVSQISTALAREGVRHRVIGPPALSRLCIASHLQEIGTNYIEPSARVAVASVQSVATYKDHQNWFAQVGLWVHDEAHHLTAKNQFGRAVSMFPNARGLGVTATPGRADGIGLGRHADGLMDVMVQGPTPRWLVEQGYLSKYRIYAPPNNLHREDLPITASGDFSAGPLREATKKSTVTGDVVTHYVKHANGKLGLTFADSIENATTIAQGYRNAGVTAEVLTGKTPDALRAAILKRFRARQVLQIVSVALIDEGFDCPSVEVVSDAAATESFNRFAQRFGRGMRVLEGKTHMMYFDHVGNVIRHGLPDAPRTWSLDRRERRGKSEASDAIPLRTCLNPLCLSVYERVLPECPYCGHHPEPALRSGPEYVDGDLLELDEATLARLRGEVARVDAPPLFPVGVGPEVVGAIRKRHAARQLAQAGLRGAVALWSGWQRHQGRSDAEAYRRFYHRYGVDVATAAALGTPEAIALETRVRADMEPHGIINAMENMQ